MTKSSPDTNAAKRVLLRLRKRGVRYWMSALIVLLVSVFGTRYVYDFLGLTEARSAVFQWVLDIRPNAPQPKFVKVVLIEDDEYWNGYPDGRRPIKRDYLARLIDKLASANARVIGLDFDIRLPDPDVMQIPAAYKNETDDLIRAVVNAAGNGTKIVLAKTIWVDQQGAYKLDGDIYQPYGICARINKNGAWENPGTTNIPVSDEAKENIACGYIALPYDMLVVPVPLHIPNSDDLDSFALAVARAENPDLVKHVLARIGTDVRYGNYISEAKLKEYNVVLSAHDLLGDTSREFEKRVRGQAVIVGAHWSSFAFDRGAPADLHLTPLGALVGAEVHANFVEALLDSRVFAGSPDWLAQLLEILFAIVAAVVFASSASFHGKLEGIIVLSLVLIAIEWVALREFGAFFDATIPFLALWLHSVYDRVVDGDSLPPSQTR